ncbi:MAG: hypothetical protein WCP68_14190 [Enhydrobacter sp.]
MKRRAAILLVASFSFTGNAFGQSPIAVKYCRDLSAAYRQAITAERPADADVSRASVNCQTNPADSIPIIEAALKKWNIDLPPK